MVLWNTTIVKFILAFIAIGVLLYFVITHLSILQPPLPLNAEEARFLRALTCSYAMCVKDSCDASIIAIGFLDKDQKISCYTKCNESYNMYHEGHKCGPNYKLEFTSEDEFTYNANYHICVPPCLSDSYRRLETDLSRHKNWEGTILGHNEYCFSKKNNQVTLGGFKYDRGCDPAIFPPDSFGLCEGVLMSSKAWGVSTCDWGDRSSNSFPIDRTSEDCALNTGHIWIGPNLENSCSPFEETNKYLSSCTFEKEQKMYVWTEKDSIDVVGIGTYYCPELILCGP